MFKSGDKVSCIYNTYLDNLTYMKEYEVIEQINDVVYIRNDRGNYSAYHLRRFKFLKDFRKEKIIKIEKSREDYV